VEDLSRHPMAIAVVVTTVAVVLETTLPPVIAWLGEPMALPHVVWILAVVAVLGLAGYAFLGRRPRP
jgi:hypothetical protein